MSFFVNARKRVYINADQDLQKLLVNEGGDTLYYGTQAVTAGSYEGSLTSGQSAVITQGKWLISNGQARVDAFELPDAVWGEFQAFPEGLSAGYNPSVDLFPSTTGKWAALDFWVVTGNGTGNRIHARSMNLANVN